MCANDAILQSSVKVVGSHIWMHQQHKKGTYLLVASIKIFMQSTKPKNKVLLIISVKLSHGACLCSSSLDTDDSSLLRNCDFCMQGCMKRGAGLDHQLTHAECRALKSTHLERVPTWSPRPCQSLDCFRWKAGLWVQIPTWPRCSNVACPQ